ncbi:predicted protein [Naegleria gruberi]|uniref:Predicted protein n=1 Tax=Naegleria gruberi TaxID=5762 RepID=D2V1A5_NAEGR|nr:uncharacterized protein NAEGRDRAFT_62815 [Naegleria gruberi]EFC49274.1 predicted protein [Naegleria gruberi]|eukprot:XP_002682018.1 predicted protein [Naegleria gruberi strain NEG-M]
MLSFAFRVFKPLIYSVVGLFQPSDPAVSSSYVRLANTLFELHFNYIENKKPISNFFITCEFDGKTVRKQVLLKGDGKRDGGIYHHAVELHPQKLMSIKVETESGRLLFEALDINTNSFKQETLTLMEMSIPDRKQELFDSIKDKLISISKNVIIGSMSITFSGKSSLLNNIFKTLGSKHVPFPVGSTEQAREAYKLFYGSYPSNDYLSSFTTEILKKNVDDVEGMESLWIWDLPGIFEFTTAGQMPTLLSLTDDLLNKLFVTKNGMMKLNGNQEDKKVNREEEEFSLKPQALIVTLPLENSFAYNSTSDNNIALYFGRISGFLSKEHNVKSVYCYTKIDETYIYQNYISKNVGITSMLDETDPTPDQMKLNLLKQFHEWDILERKDNNFPDMVNSDHTIPFLSINSPTKEIDNFFQVQYLEVLNLALDKCFQKKSSLSCESICIVKK